MYTACLGKQKRQDVGFPVSTWEGESWAPVSLTYGKDGDLYVQVSFSHRGSTGV